MYVIKRDGREEPVMFDKITSRIKKLCYGLEEFVDPVIVSQKVCTGVYRVKQSKEKKRKEKRKKKKKEKRKKKKCIF